jgi:uncharacterized protein
VKNANPVFRRTGLLGLTLLAAALTWTSCDRNEQAVAPSARVKTVGDYFPIAVGDKVVRMQLAVQPREMEQGLMFRRDLSRNDGMLFVYERPQQMGFWMRNTPTALDIGFFTADGVLQEIYPMHPFDERTVQSRGDQHRFALEVNQGWFRDNNVRVGAKLDLTALAAAMKERGFEPRKYGLRN